MTTDILNVQADANFSFFLTRNMYSGNFYKIWVREVLQNAVDAKAKSVKFSNNRISEKSVSVLTVIDDGVGMTKEIVKNNFLVLGSSNKDEVIEKGVRKATGGLGIAKSLCTGGDVRYPGPFGDEVLWYVETTAYDGGELRTYYFDSEMIGKAPIKELPANSQTGTKIVVHRKDYMYDSELKDIVHNSNVVPVYFHEDKLMQLSRARKQDVGHLFSDEVDTSWLDVYHKKNVMKSQENLIIYRINGIVQFIKKARHIPGALIFEIKTDKKPWDDEYPLTPTREQIKDGYGYKEIIDVIVENFKVRQPDENEETFIFETFENDFFNPTTYSRYFEDSIEKSGFYKEREDSLVEEGKSSTDFTAIDETPDDETSEFLEREENEYENAIEEKERIELLRYENEQREKEEQRKRTAQVQEVFNKTLHSFKNNVDDEKIMKFNSVFSSHLSSITVKREKQVKTSIDLYSAKNSKTLLAFKVFIDMVFELSKDNLDSFSYEIGWSLNSQQRVEFIRRDNKNYLLLNPIDLNISDVRLFTNKVLNKLVLEMLKREYYYTSDYMLEKYFDIMENGIYPNIRSFEKISKKILRTSI